MSGQSKGTTSGDGPPTAQLVKRQPRRPPRALPAAPSKTVAVRHHSPPALAPGAALEPEVSELPAPASEAGPESPPDQVYLGGLFTCCLDTLWRVYAHGPARLAKEGAVLHCTYHPDMSNHVMVFHDGYWGWDSNYRGANPLGNGSGVLLIMQLKDGDFIATRDTEDEAQELVDQCNKLITDKLKRHDLEAYYKKWYLRDNSRHSRPNSVTWAILVRTRERETNGSSHS